jgi:hypothetical protein
MKEEEPLHFEIQNMPISADWERTPHKKECPIPLKSKLRKVRKNNEYIYKSQYIKRWIKPICARF